MQRDELPKLGDLRTGYQVIVIPDPSAWTNQAVPARVVKADQVWIEVEALKGEPLPEQARRFRRDTQSTSDRPECGDPVFYSMEQWMRRLRNAKARAYLNELGIAIDASSPFASDPTGLADAIRRGLGEAEL